MTLEEAIKQFEARFERVVEFDPTCENPRVVPNTEAPYFVITCGGRKPEGDLAEWNDESYQPTPEAAAERWFARAVAEHEKLGGKTLYWRTRPDLSDVRRMTEMSLHSGGRHYGPTLHTVYSRLAFA